MRKVSSAIVLSVLVLVCVSSARADYYDVVDGLYANIPAGATGGPAAQSGIDHWWYKYDHTTRFGQQGSPIVRNPSTFLLMELGSDGTTWPYGWAANVGGAINDRAVFRNGSIANRMVLGGTTQGDGVYSVAENNAQVALEWVAPGDGTADVNFALIGRNDPENDIEWHLATWDGTTWNDLDFVLVTQAHTPAAPATLAASGLGLSAGESIYLYGQIADHDAYDGTVITGGIEFTARQDGLIPEPATLALAAAGLTVLGGYLRRRRAA